MISCVGALVCDLLLVGFWLVGVCGVWFAVLVLLVLWSGGLPVLGVWCLRFGLGCGCLDFVVWVCLLLVVCSLVLVYLLAASCGVILVVCWLVWAWFGGYASCG